MGHVPFKSCDTFHVNRMLLGKHEISDICSSSAPSRSLLIPCRDVSVCVSVYVCGGWGGGGFKGGHNRGHGLAVIHHLVTFPQAGAHTDRGATQTFRPGCPMAEACSVPILLGSPYHPRIQRVQNSTQLCHYQ